MMEFRTIKAALITTLGNYAAGRFVTIGYQRQTKSADTINDNRLVQVYYSSGDVPKSGGRLTGPKIHEMTFNLDMTVSASAKADLAVLQNPNSTAGERSTALAGVQTAGNQADDLLDELIEIIFQILYDGRNLNLGLTAGSFGSRWIGKIQKDLTIEDGQFVVKTAQMQYTCKTSEQVPGDVGNTPATVTIDTTMDIDGDDDQKTGVTVENT